MKKARNRSEEGYEFPEGFHMRRFYPVDGESAVAELWFGQHDWGQIALSGVRQDETGEARISDAEIVVSLFPPPPGAEPQWWEFELAGVLALIGEAQDWLLENERHRLPVEEGVGMSAAAQALSKVGLESLLEREEN